MSQTYTGFEFGKLLTPEIAPWSPTPYDHRLKILQPPAKFSDRYPTPICCRRISNCPGTHFWARPPGGSHTGLLTHYDHCVKKTHPPAKFSVPKPTPIRSFLIFSWPG